MAADLSKLSDADLMALKSGDLSKVSDAGLLALKGAAPEPFNPAKSVMQLGGALASGTVAAPVAGLAGLAATAIPGMSGADTVRKVQDALTYQPQDENAKKALDLIAAPATYLASKADQAGAATAEATGSPMLGAAVNTGIQALPLALGPIAKAVRPALVAKAAEGEAAANLAKSQDSVRNATLAAGQKEGLVTAPSAVNPTGANKFLESIAGKAAVAQDAQLRNQPKVNAIARRELGLSQSTAITPELLDNYREMQAAPYREVAKLPPVPNPDWRPFGGSTGAPQNLLEPKQAVKDLREARNEAQTYFKGYDRTGRPEDLTRASAAWDKAQQLEASLEKAAELAGQPELVTKLRAAREKIAKSYDIERALNLGDANVDPRAIGRALKSGKPLTGGLETVGKFENAFHPYMREASRVPTPGVGALEPMGGAILGAGAAAAAGPAGWLAAGVPLIRGPVRNLVLSEAYQRNHARPNYGNGGLAARLAEMDPNAIEAAIAAGSAQRNKK